jgi:hypothetical protein
VCWRPCSSSWSRHLLREEFLSTPIQSPLSGSPYRSFTTDINYGSPRLRAYTDEGNQVSLEDVIDQLDEAWDVALLHSAQHQQAMQRGCANERPVARGAPSDRLPSPCKLPFLEKNLPRNFLFWNAITCTYSFEAQLRVIKCYKIICEHKFDGV